MPSSKTPWFPSHVLPVRVGWYEVQSKGLNYRHKMFLTGNRRYWDGKQWKAGWFQDQVSIFGKHEGHQWRGFTTEQK